MSYHQAVLSAAPLLKREWNKNERFALQNAARIALPKHRAAACLRYGIRPSSDIIVSRTAKSGTRLGGLMVCNASHVCPVCHHNKMAEEKATIAKIVAGHYAAIGLMVDAVLTVPHAARESLGEVLYKLESVWKSLRSKPIWRELADELGIVGCTRRLEVTLTANGWHPHYHVSLLCDWRATKGIKGRSRHAALADAHALVAGRWSEAGKRAGSEVCLFAQAAVAIVDAVEAEKAIAYTCKNMGYSSKDNSLTPMDLLRIIDQVADPLAVHAAKRLYADYAAAIKGKHTLSFLGTARAAKAAITEAAEELSDSDEAERLGTVSADAWGAVVKAGLREVVAQVETREDLAAAILRAACFAGYTSIPTGWLTLTPAIKTVIEVKGEPDTVSSLEGLPA